MVIYAGYVVVALVLAGILSASTDRKGLSFILIFWVLAQPVMQGKFVISYPGMPFDLQPNRILLLLLLPYFLFFTVAGKSDFRQSAIRRPPYEKYLGIYFLCVIFSLLFNREEIGFKCLFAAPLEILTFIALYLTAKAHATPSVLEAIIKAIILLAVVNAFLAIIQTFIDHQFLKTGDPRLAFGAVVRATGIFQAEYELGYFQILAVIVAMIRYKGAIWLYLLLPLLIFSVLLTFHRLDIIILSLCMGIFMWRFWSKAKFYAVAGGMVFLCLLVLTSYPVLESSAGKVSIVEDRLKADTVTGRFKQYEVVLFALAKYPFGMGDYDNKNYYKLMEKHKMVYSINPGTEAWFRTAFRVHNGYLEVGILYGPLTMLVFITLLGSMIWDYKGMVEHDFPYTSIPFFAVLIWVLSNVSNGVSAFRHYYVLLIALLAGVFVAMQRTSAVKKENLSAPSNLSPLTILAKDN